MALRSDAVPDALSIGVLTSSVSRRAGGLFNSVRQGTIALQNAGAAVSVYGLKDGFTDADYSAWLPLEPNVFEDSGPLTKLLAPDLRLAMLAGDHDILHVHGIWDLSVHVSYWRRRTKKPVIISPRGMLDSWALRNGSMKKRLARFLYEDANLRGAACLHALNEAEARAIRALGFKNPIAVIPNGIHVPDSGPQANSLSSDQTDRRCLLFIGRLHPKKGLAELIDAWALVKKDVPTVARQWRIVICGWDDGGHEATLRTQIENHQLESDISLVGPVFGRAKDELLSDAHAFVLPSFSEGLPMAVLEAWAYRLPVFMTSACNIPEGFAAKAAIEINTVPTTMAQALLEGLTLETLKNYGQQGRALVERNFSWPSIATKHVEVYRWMVEGGSLPECVSVT